MLEHELRGESYNKSAERRLVSRQLSGRSDASIEMKHGNISAVLRDAGFPWIDGYKPRPNYQGLLSDIALSRLEDDTEIQRLALRIVESPVSAPPTLLDLLSRLTAAPSVLDEARDAVAGQAIRRARKGIDYLAREQHNRALGKAGEEFVIQFERERLRAAGRNALASKVEHVALTRGDGLGFDVLSFDDDGDERFIEVKTTSFSALTPFYLTSSELEFSGENVDAYHLYRVYAFRNDPRLFALSGDLSVRCSLTPSQFVAVPR